LDRFGDAAPVLAVNLAVPQADDPDLVRVVNRVLEQTGLPPQQLQLGFPVRALACDDESEADENLRLLVENGVRATIHGFGGGPGGLVLVEDLPVRSVWIAEGLVRRLTARPESAAARGLTGQLELMHSCEVTVMAGNIRDEAHAERWHAMGVDVAAGEWSGAPGPPELITERLRTAI
jgi:EAL domain-containing protein (putative c-di-GMP-specific phosphodiesterase class I)